MDRHQPADEPDEPAPPRTPPPWWADHAAREHDIIAPTRDHPADSPDQSRQRWYRDARVPPDQQPAAFRPETAAKVPPADGPGARGRLDLHDGTTGIPIDSGSKTGLTDALRSRLGHLPSGFTAQNRAHVEAHAAAYLHLHPHITDATLYLNRIPCPGPRGCRDNLDAMLPANTTLTVYAPKGWAAIYHGTPEP